MISKTHKAKPVKKGIVFKNGKLFIFRFNKIIVLKGWPDPRSYEKILMVKNFIDFVSNDQKLELYSNGWRHIRPKIEELIPDLFDWGIIAAEIPYRYQLSLPFNGPINESKAEKEREACVRFIENVPLDIKRAITLYSKRQWHMFSLFSRCPGSLDLANSNPSLAFALASNWVFHKPAVKKPLRAARSLLRKKQRFILEWLGYPSKGDIIVNLFRKIELQCLNINFLLYLRDVLKDERNIKILCHLSRVEPYALRLLLHPDTQFMLSPRLMYELSDEPDIGCRANFYSHLEDIFDMLRATGRSTSSLHFNSFKKVNELHDSLVEEINAANYNHEAIVFPPAPVPGNNNILPMRDSSQLYIEGKEQSNCVASYVPRVARGSVYIYKLMQPERCTVSLVNRSGKWIISEIKTARNHEPSRETVNYVKQWLGQFYEEEKTLVYGQLPYEVNSSCI